MDTGGIDFDPLGDGPWDKLPVEVEDEPEEPVPGVHCVPKAKAKRYENSVSSIISDSKMFKRVFGRMCH